MTWKHATLTSLGRFIQKFKATSADFMAASSAPPPPPLPPSAAKKGFLRRIFPLLLTANIAIGAYVFSRTWKKEPAEKGKDAAGKIPASPAEPALSEKTASTVYLPAPAVARPPIPEHEQSELPKWILEEKRKVKPRDAAEKKKIDEEKALLKQIIRSESIPVF